MAKKLSVTDLLNEADLVVDRVEQYGDDFSMLDLAKLVHRLIVVLAAREVIDGD